MNPNLEEIERTDYVVRVLPPLDTVIHSEWNLECPPHIYIIEGKEDEAEVIND
jgi:hypothetical protein